MTAGPIPPEELPRFIALSRDWLAHADWEVKCPMGEAHGKQVVLCRKAKDFLTVAHDPLAIAMFCASTHGHQQCPVWQSEKDGTGMIERTLAAREEADLREATERQIETGVRVDDRGLEKREGYSTDQGVQHLVDDEEVGNGTS